MSYLLPAAFLLVQLAVYAFAPPFTAPVAYIAMVAAPLLAAGAALWRARKEAASGARGGWIAIAAAMGIWSLGAFGNLWQELVLGYSNEMYRDSMLAFDLVSVPITFLLAGEWPPGGRRLARAFDGVIALALGYVYFRYTWTVISERGMPGETGVAYLVWLIDVQDLFLAAGALVRWHVARENSERDLFRALSAYSVVYLVLAFANDHYFAGDTAKGPEYGAIVTVAFALFAGLALRRPSEAPIRRAGARTERIVQSAIPVLLAGALLTASLFLIRVDYAFGSAGVLIAVLGYAARNTLTQARHIARGDALQRERIALRAIALTDALTGVANRHFLDQELARLWRGERRSGQLLALLMIDIDYFKQFNDCYGHPAGDACLREVARVLQQALVRPSDVLARYGGEEFVVLLHDADTEGSRVVAERLRTAVEALRMENRGSPLGVVTVSAGAISVSMDGGATSGDLLAAADRALYEAKCGGRNQVRGLALAKA